MPYIKAPATVFAAGIIRIRRKQPAALSIRVVCTFADGVIAVKSDFAAQATIKADKHLALIETTTCFVAVDLTLRRIGSDPARTNPWNYRARQWSVDITRADDMLDLDVVEAD